MCGCKSLYLFVTAVIGGAVAGLHIARLVQKWPVQVADWKMPLGVSWAAAIVGGILCVWGLSLLCGCCCCATCKTKKEQPTPPPA
jgi:hypothetical protein